MKRRNALALFLALVGTAHATDQDVYNKLLNKVAPPTGNLFARFKPGMACACRIPPNPGTYAGVLAQTGGDLPGRITCLRISFAADGALLGSATCDDYVVLGR